MKPIYKVWDDRPADIIKLTPQGTNSTMFTECCGVAICDYEKNCPKCGRLVIGYDSETDHMRGLVRWRSATKYWARRER